MTNFKPDKKIWDSILKEIQHNETTTLQYIKSKHPNFHWSSISYEKTGDTALHIASRIGYLTVIDYLLKEFQPCAVDVKNKDDKTPLHEAAQFGQFDSILKLCSFGADINALRRGDWTALMLACTKVQPDVSLGIVKALVERDAEINVCNKDGWTCVHILAREGGEDIFDYLATKGLKVNIKTKNGRSPLHIAALHGNMAILTRLIEYVDINSRDGCGNTPLHEAILGQHIEIASYLVLQGADITSRNNSDLSVLHLSASQDSPDVIDYLLKEFNLDMNNQNKNGWTVGHCAARKGSKEIYEHLKKIGADLTIKDNFGRTAMDYFQL